MNQGSVLWFMSYAVRLGIDYTIVSVIGFTGCALWCYSYIKHGHYCGTDSSFEKYVKLLITYRLKTMCAITD